MKKKKKKGASFLTICIAVLGAMIAQGIVHTIFPKNRSVDTLSGIQTAKVDSLITEMDRTLSKINTKEEFHDFVGTKLKDSEVAIITAPMGFFMTADMLKEFCMPYIPERYIGRVNSYKTDYSLDEEFIKYFNEQGANKDQAQLFLKTVKATIMQQGIRIIKNDFLLFSQKNPSYTKKDYCKIYDLYADNIISDKFKELDQTISLGYKKYIRK